MNPFRAVQHQLYLLQLENYNLARFLRLIRLNSVIPRIVPRKPLVWTLKLRAVFVLALILKIAVAALLASLFTGTLAVIVFLAAVFVFSVSFFVFLVLATVLLWPADFILKFLIISAARRKISKFPNLKIIGITGSYGKTTTKESLAAILAQKYKILKTPENINTPVGVARLVLKNLRPDTQIFIVEMGAYKRGDIRALCKITRPAVAVLTGINEAHLERFGSLENTLKAKFEIVENALPDGMVVLNGDDRLVMQNYQKYGLGRKVFFYKCGDIGDSKFNEDGSGTEIRGVKIPILGEYILGVVSACVIISKQLGLTDREIEAGMREIKPVPHRLQVLPSATPGILVVDDSYNGNPDGAREAIKVLAKFKARRKIYITPGLVEMGQRVYEVHREIGRQLVQVADVVILIRNSVSYLIAEGILCAPEGYPQIFWYKDAKAAHAALPQILKSGDVVLFQNDWPDNYL